MHPSYMLVQLILPREPFLIPTSKIFTSVTLVVRTPVHFGFAMHTPHLTAHVGGSSEFFDAGGFVAWKLFLDGLGLRKIG
jgi:hypothetical protein